MFKEESSFEVRKAVICFQYVERIKSELIVASRLLMEIGELRGDELSGAKKLIGSFMDALLSEINIANNVVGLRNFWEARIKVVGVKEKILADDYAEATRRVSEAISFITTSGQQAAQILKQNNLL